MEHKEGEARHVRERLNRRRMLWALVVAAILSLIVLVGTALSWAGLTPLAGPFHTLVYVHERLTRSEATLYYVEAESSKKAHHRKTTKRVHRPNAKIETRPTLSSGPVSVGDRGRLVVDDLRYIALGKTPDDYDEIRKVGKDPG